MSRVYNFSAGPSMMPEWVLKKASNEMLEYGATGQSVMEMSHRSKEYEAIIRSCESLLRELMNIPDNYKVCLLYTSWNFKRDGITVTCLSNLIIICFSYHTDS